MLYNIKFSRLLVSPSPKPFTLMHAHENKLELSLANHRVSVSKMVHFEKAYPKKRKCLSFINIWSELDQIRFNNSPRCLL